MSRRRRRKVEEVATRIQCSEAKTARQMAAADGRRSRMSATTSSGRESMVVGSGDDAVEVILRLFLFFIILSWRRGTESESAIRVGAGVGEGGPNL
jgi:hypothetical protein